MWFWRISACCCRQGQLPLSKMSKYGKRMLAESDGDLVKGNSYQGRRTSRSQISSGNLAAVESLMRKYGVGFVLSRWCFSAVNSFGDLPWGNWRDNEY